MSIIIISRGATRENATEFITRVLENNLDITIKKKNCISYFTHRPRGERIDTHGLFSNEREFIVLSRVAKEAMQMCVEAINAVIRNKDLLRVQRQEEKGSPQYRVLELNL